MPIGAGTSSSSQACRPSEQLTQVSYQLPFKSSPKVIALGSDLKCQIFVLEDDTLRSAGEFGSLADCNNYRRFKTTADALCDSFYGSSCVMAHDLHPAFATTAFVRGRVVRAQARRYATHSASIQHHHAHIATCMIDNHITRPVIGVVCDGAGYGADGQSWGCEVLVADLLRFTRLGHLDYFPLPGGDAAAVEPWRCALSLVNAAFESGIPANIHRIFDAVPPPKLIAVKQLLAGKSACPMTSSLGRLFDAVSFMCGICDRNTTEGRAARLLESVADPSESAYPYADLVSPRSKVIDTRSLIQAICCDLANRVAISAVSGRFHATIADALAALVIRSALTRRIDTVVLSGGCFANDLLRTQLTTALRDKGLNVRQHRRTSCGDLDLGLGQAAIAAANTFGNSNVSCRTRKAD